MKPILCLLYFLLSKTLYLAAQFSPSINSYRGPLLEKYKKVHYVQHVYAALHEGKWGIVDEQGKIIIPFIYSKMGWTDFLKVKYKGKYGSLNLKGKEMLPCKYDKVDGYRRINNSDTAYHVKLGNSWAWVDQSGEPLTSLLEKYKRVKYVKPLRYIALRMGKWGLIDDKGRNIVPFIYSKMDWTSNFLTVKHKGKYGALNLEGEEILPCKYDGINRQIWYDDKGSYYFVTLGKKWAWVDESGTAITGFKYDKFTKKKYNDSVGEGRTHSKIYRQGKFGFMISKEHLSFTECVYEDLEYLFRSDDIPLMALKKNGKWGFMHRLTYDVLVPFIYDDFEQISETGLIKVKKEGKYGILNSYGFEIIACSYDRIISRYNGFFIQKDGRWAAFDGNGAQLTPFDYHEWKCEDNYALLYTKTKVDSVDLVDYLGHGMLYRARKQFVITKSTDKWGIINESSNLPYARSVYDSIIISNNMWSLKYKGKWGYGINSYYIYDEVRPTNNEGLGIARVGGNYGVIRPESYSSGHYKDPFTYDEIVDFCNSCGITAAKKNGKWGFIDELQNEITPFEYEEVHSFTRTLKKTHPRWKEYYYRAAVKKDSKWGFVNDKGEVVIPIIYDAVTPFFDKEAEVFLNGNNHVIDIHGQKTPF